VQRHVVGLVMGCGTRVSGALLAVLLLAAPVAAEGWRPELAPEPTDPEWLTQLDARLAPVHGTLNDTLALIGAGSEAERDAYIVIVQENAAKGLRILDLAEPAPACARDYVAVERVMFLMLGDTADAFRQFIAGSSQAGEDVNALGPAAVYMLGTYADTIRADACATAMPVPTEGPMAVPATATPIETGEPS
jgi:hypothetical protein